MGGFVSRGFKGRRRPAEQATRLPPGQYAERGFPVLTAGPTPRIDLADWRLKLEGLVARPRGSGPGRRSRRCPGRASRATSTA